MNMPAQYFRAGVGAVIFNSKGHILALERADIRGSWQLPQGGLESAEEPKAAVLREVAEETGIMEKDLTLIDSFPEPLVYELPASARNSKTGRGQVQYWFLFKFDGGDNEIDVNTGGEFSGWDWIPFKNLVKSVVGFRRPLYQKLAERFEPYLSKQ